MSIAMDFASDGGGFDFVSVYQGGSSDFFGGSVPIEPGNAPGDGIDFTIDGLPIGIGGGGGTPSVNQTLTQLVNSFETALKANLSAWQIQSRSAADALATAWRLMDAMVIECRKFGAAGVKSASERDRRINPPMLRWDWIAYYIDPITGSNTALPPVPGGGTAPGQTPGTGGSPAPLQTIGGINPLYIGAALLLLIFMMRR